MIWGKFNIIIFYWKKLIILFSSIVLDITKDPLVGLSKARAIFRIFEWIILIGTISFTPPLELIKTRIPKKINGSPTWFVSTLSSNPSMYWMNDKRNWWNYSILFFFIGKNIVVGGVIHALWPTGGKETRFTRVPWVVGNWVVLVLAMWIENC